MKQLIMREKELITDAEIHLVFVNIEGKPEKIPAEIIENFMPYVKNEIKYFYTYVRFEV